MGVAGGEIRPDDVIAKPQLHPVRGDDVTCGLRVVRVVALVQLPSLLPT